MTFRFDVFHHIGDDNVSGLELLLRQLLKQGNDAMATQQELANQVNAVNDKLGKIVVEEQKLVQTIDDLKTQVANAPVDPALQAAVDKVVAQAGVLDDLVPDDVPPPVTV